MKKQLALIALISILCIEVYSQINFENGYFIDESNNKIECLIKNIDWKYNPTEFEYKLSKNELVQTGTIRTIKEFGINNVSKYYRAKTNIDRSSENIDQMSSERNPNFQEEVIFLKVLIEGAATMFIYIDGNLTRFFYKLGDSEIEQLVYKKYLIDNKILHNGFFKQQLFLNLKSKDIQLSEIERLNYSKRDLKKIFIKYNESASTKYVNYEPKKGNDLFHLTIRPGLNYSNLKIQSPELTSINTDFESSFGIRFGIEMEFILPFNKNKWGVIVEPAYQYFNAEQSEERNDVVGGMLIKKVEYKSIEMPVGIRHYFFLNDYSKLFANISYCFNYSINSSYELSRNDESTHTKLTISPRRNLAYGLGYKYKKRYNLELRYSPNREIIGDYLTWKSNYSSLNLILGISLL